MTFAVKAWFYLMSSTLYMYGCHIYLPVAAAALFAHHKEQHPFITHHFATSLTYQYFYG